MLKEFKDMSRNEKEGVHNDISNGIGRFKVDFKVEGKVLSEMTDSEKAIVYMQVLTGSNDVTRDFKEYDPTTRVIPVDENEIRTTTPYGIVCVSNVIR